MRKIKGGAIISKINRYVYDGKLPRNINYNYNYGSILGLILGMQIITGIFLACNYIAETEMAFKSVERIMREVPLGYMVRYMHANGAGIMFIIVYLHISRGLKYGSYTKERIGTWTIGVIMLLVMIITAFLGYSLVYGQMSYWAIAVITNIITIIPYYGGELVEYIYGSYNIGNTTIGRFYTLHYVLPMVLSGLTIIHLITLHRRGGTNPMGIKEIKTKINFHPYYTTKDIIGFGIIIVSLIAIISFIPNKLGHTDNYIEANPMVTPAHIVPEFYLLYFYMGLRAIPNKILGVGILGTIILILLVIPYLHKGIIATGKLRPMYRIMLNILFIDFIIGTYLGATEVGEPYGILSKIVIGYYIVFFIIIIPVISMIETIMFVMLQKIREPLNNQ